MNPEKRLEILEAFASSKPTEFDGFTHAYLERYPEQPEPIIADIVLGEGEYSLPVEEKPKRKRTSKTVEVIESV